MQKHDAVLVLDRIQMHVGHLAILLCQPGELEVMRGEQRQRLVLLHQMPGNGPGQRQAVEGRGAAADLIHQHQAVRPGVVQDVGRFGHLHHESRAPAGEVVRGANAGEDLIDRPQREGGCRYKTAAMRQQHDQRYLPHIGRLAAHVRAGDQQHAAAGRELGVVGNEGLAQCRDLRLDHRMPALAQLQPRLVAPVRAAPVPAQRHLGKTGQHIARRQGTRDTQQSGHFRLQLLQQRFPERFLQRQGALLCR